jgi:hypothetical protein
MSDIIHVAKAIHNFGQPNARGHNWDTLFLEEINTGTWPSWSWESQK